MAEEDSQYMVGPLQVAKNKIEAGRDPSKGCCPLSSTSTLAFSILVTFGAQDLQRIEPQAPLLSLAPSDRQNAAIKRSSTLASPRVHVRCSSSSRDLAPLAASSQALVAVRAQPELHHRRLAVAVTRCCQLQPSAYPVAFSTQASRPSSPFSVAVEAETQQAFVGFKARFGPLQSLLPVSASLSPWTHRISKLVSLLTKLCLWS